MKWIPIPIKPIPTPEATSKKPAGLKAYTPTSQPPTATQKPINPIRSPSNFLGGVVLSNSFVLELNNAPMPTAIAAIIPPPTAE